MWVLALGKVSKSALEKTRGEFSTAFRSKYAAYADADIINIDETGVRNDIPPSRTLAVRGGSAKVTGLSTHSARLTAVLVIRADGELPAFDSLIMTIPSDSLRF